MWSSQCNENWQEKLEYFGDTLPSTNPILPGLGLNPGHYGGKPVTNHLSYGTALHTLLTSILGAAEWSASYLACYISCISDTHWIWKLSGLQSHSKHSEEKNPLLLLITKHCTK
jgi:hypothetical protein